MEEYIIPAEEGPSPNKQFYVKTYNLNEIPNWFKELDSSKINYLDKWKILEIENNNKYRMVHRIGSMEIYNNEFSGKLILNCITFLKRKNIEYNRKDIEKLLENFQEFSQKYLHLLLKKEKKPIVMATISFPKEFENYINFLVEKISPDFEVVK